MPREGPCHDALYYWTARLQSLEESPAKGQRVLPLIGGILLLIGGLSVTPFSQARRDPPTRFSRCFSVSSGQFSARIVQIKNGS